MVPREIGLVQEILNIWESMTQQCPILWTRDSMKNDIKINDFSGVIECAVITEKVKFLK